ncbi:MAG: ChaN family lipoprotein [Pyrinomonadaceae bacterium]
MMKYGLRRFASILLFAGLAAQLAAAQGAPSAHYRVFDSKGQSVTLQTIIDSLEGADVLFVGETHDNAVAHLLEAELLRRADERFGAASQRRRDVALSLEMFERDAQTVLDEYLAGLITERHFLLSSRPWRNYETDYRPLIEYARARRLPVIAANAPARYVSRVSNQGPGSLTALSKDVVKNWLPPLPFPPASEAYAAKFNRFMSGGVAASPAHTPAQASAHGSLHLLEAQTLRDASMAYRIAEFLRRGRDPLVVQVNGTFHSEERMGVPEQLARYRPKARSVVVTIVPDEGFPDFDAARLASLGDFVIITDPAVKR